MKFLHRAQPMAIRYVITGASGFLGGYLLSLCDPQEAVGVYGSHRPAESGRRWLRCDFSRPEAAAEKIAALEPQICIHAAAKSNLDWCEKNPREARRVNTESAVVLARRCQEVGCRFVFISTDMVFDGRRGNYGESDAPSPINWYGRTKVEAEERVLAAHPEALVARMALIYGFPYFRDHGGSFLSWLVGRLEQGQPAPLFTDQFRTPVEVGEAAQAVLALAGAGAKGIVHIAGSERLDRLTFGRYVCESFGYDPALLQRTVMAEIPSQAPRPRDLSLQTGRLQQLLGRRLSGCREGLARLSREYSAGNRPFSG